MPTLHLHLGPGKTGTTWIQTSFRLSRERLRADHGVDYPAAAKERADMADTKIIVGNGRGALESPETLVAKLCADGKARSHRLYSSEFLFHELVAWADLSELPRAVKEAGFDRVRLLLFVRDPLGALFSGWQQEVKRTGVWRDLDPTDRRLGHVGQVADLLERLADVDGVETTALNYSRRSDRLLESVESWLGTPEGTLIRPDAPRVNRSMTAAEIALLRAVNAVPGAKERRVGGKLADALCEKLPGIEPETVRPPEDAQRAFWEMMRPDVERANALLPEAERYRCDVAVPSPAALEPGGSFSDAQLKVVAEALAGEIVTAWRAREVLVADPASALSARSLARALVKRVLARLLRGMR